MVLVIATTLMAASAASAQQMTTGFLDRRTTVDGLDYPYQVYVPRDYDPAREWPVILFLHGAGERGSDGIRQTLIGLPDAIRRAPDRFPAIVVMPQAPADSSWQRNSARAAMQALDETIAAYNTDPARVYLSGLSMGGNGAWYLAWQNADRFAALAVVCGFVTPFRGWPDFVTDGDGTRFDRIAARISRLPVWIVHGEADPVVPVSESREMRDALLAAGADVTYRELPDVGHDSWVDGYRDPDFAAWLFAQRKPSGMP
jgi:predicted peptidase